MRALILLCACVPAFALSNAVTISNLSASAQTSRTWAVHRYFADKEICGQPQPFTGGSAIPNWQSDVTSRWPADSACSVGSGGYAKTAMISFELTVAGSSSAVVEFRASANACHLGNAATCAAAGASQTDLLNFDAGGGAGSWGLKVSATTGGITLERSARTMMAAGQYQVLKNGPLFTEILVREGPQSVQGTATRNTSFGWRCTANCAAPYASAAWADASAWYSIRPTFLLRFYRRWGRVEGDSILQNAWIDRHVDQRMDSYAVRHGAGEATSCYTAPGAVVIPARSTVWDGPCWSTDPADATNTKIDLNPAYLVYSKAIPEYDTTMPVSAAAIALENAVTVGRGAPDIGWGETDKGVTTTASISPHLGWGQWERAAAQGGGAHWVAILPRGSARYLISMDNTMLGIMMGGARAFMHFPISSLSPLTSTFWTGSGRTSFGQPISLLAHPTFASASNNANSVPDTFRDPSGTKVTTACATCMVSCADRSSATLGGCSSYATNTVNMFGYDLAHSPNVFYVPWLVTGKQFLTEALWHQAAWASAVYSTASPLGAYNNERVGPIGYVFDVWNTIRAMAWTMRIKASAAVATPDSLNAEKAYFSQMVNGALAIDEGRLGITNGAFPPPDPTNGDGRYGCANKTSWLPTDPLWCIGRYLFDRGFINPVGFPHWYGESTGLWACNSCRQDMTSGSLSPWMVVYASASSAMLTDLGFPAGKVHEKTTGWLLGLFFHSSGPNGPLAAAYRTPMRNAAGTGYLQSWAAVKDARVLSARLARAVTGSSTEILVTNVLSNSVGVSDIYNTLDVINLGGVPFQVGNELVGLDYVTTTYIDTTVDPSTDRGTMASHTFQEGDLVRVKKYAGGGGGAFPLSVVDGGSMCMYGKYDCDFYVKVINSTTLEFYLDSGLTQKVDWTAADAGLLTGQSNFRIQGISGVCPTASCRGLQGTGATSHAVGEPVILTNAVLSSYQIGTQGPHGSTFYAALATAAERGLTYTDSVSGKLITGERAFETFRRWYYGLHQFGGNTNGCAGLSIIDCDNPMWSYKPRGTPGNVRLVGNSLLYNAPDGAGCRYAISATPFASTDDSGDTLSIAGPRARTISVPSGTQYYRISCGRTGRAAGQVTAP